MKLGRLLEKKLKENLVSVTFPEEIEVTFSSIYGHEKEVEVLRDIVNYFSNTSTNKIKPHTSYVIAGPVGIGKASLMYALSKESQIPIITIDFSLFRVNSIKETRKTLKLIFDTARKLRDTLGGAIISFNNSHEIDMMEDDAVIFYSNLMKNLYDVDNIFMFLLTVKDIVLLPAMIIDNNLFDTPLTLDYPKYEVREKIIEDCLKKSNVKLATDISIQRLAKDTLGETPQSIAYIVRETILYSIRQNHEEVTQNDFAETIMRLSAGENKYVMTEKERELTAYHEAGHVIAGYFSDPEGYKLSRVEITPRTQSLGLTCGDTDENKLSYFKKDYENMIIHFLGGLAAEELKYKDHTSGVRADLSMATATASNMIRLYGMGKSIGPMVPLIDITDSQHTRAKYEEEINETLKRLSLEAYNIISEHILYLDALASALLEKEVVLGNEIEKIFAKVDSEIHKM